MRVLHIESGRHLYGGAAQVRHLLAVSDAAGAENVLVCARGGELSAAAREDGAAEVVEAPMRGDLDLALAGRLLRVLRRVRPDVVHVHSRRGADLWAGVAAAVARVPAVVTRRVDSSETGAWARLKYRPYVRVVALSRAIEAQLRAAGVPAAKIVRIPSAVDAARYRPDPLARARVLAAFGLEADALVIGVVAQLIVRKGHASLLAALAELAPRVPRLRVLCFGRGRLEASLRTEIAACGLERHVQLAGFRHDLPDLMPGVDLLVHPAAREGLGVALLEAASCALPIVAAAAGGVLDVLEHERTALLVPVNDVRALGAAIERLLRDPELGRRLGAAARRDAERRFSVGALGAAHAELYATVGREARAARGAYAQAASEPRSAAR
jgi:glycosyltransferase involved in cell wall biosynthesis